MRTTLCVRASLCVTHCRSRGLNQGFKSRYEKVAAEMRALREESDAVRDDNVAMKSRLQRSVEVCGLFPCPAVSAMRC
jgi:hypothetical protein